MGWGVREWSRGANAMLTVIKDVADIEEEGVVGIEYHSGITPINTW